MARRTMLALLLCATMLSGCTGIDSPDWGDDGIEVDWNGPDNPVNIKSAFGNNSMMSNLTAVGCNETGKMPSSSDLSADNYEPAMPVVLSGWVSAVHHYQNGAGMYEDSISRAVSTAVVIEHMSYDSAVSNYDNGIMGTSVQVKDWGDPNDDGRARPFTPETAGNPKLEMQEEETDFHAAGLIPASADVLEGMEAINWHKPVKITGYMLYSPSAPSPYDYYWTNVAESKVKTTAYCELLRTGVDGFRGNILVMSIETPDEGYISSTGAIVFFTVTVIVVIEVIAVVIVVIRIKGKGENNGKEFPTNLQKMLMSKKWDDAFWPLIHAAFGIIAVIWLVNGIIGPVDVAGRHVAFDGAEATWSVEQGATISPGDKYPCDKALQVSKCANSLTPLSGDASSMPVGFYWDGQGWTPALSYYEKSSMPVGFYWDGILFTLIGLLGLGGSLFMQYSVVKSWRAQARVLKGDDDSDEDDDEEEGESRAREHYDSLITQGYPEHEALPFTQQHFPAFQLVDSNDSSTFEILDIELQAKKDTPDLEKNYDSKVKLIAGCVGVILMIIFGIFSNSWLVLESYRKNIVETNSFGLFRLEVSDLDETIYYWECSSNADSIGDYDLCSDLQTLGLFTVLLLTLALIMMIASIYWYATNTQRWGRRFSLYAGHAIIFAAVCWASFGPVGEIYTFALFSDEIDMGLNLGFWVVIAAGIVSVNIAGYSLISEIREDVAIGEVAMGNNNYQIEDKLDELLAFSLGIIANAWLGLVVFFIALASIFDSGEMMRNTVINIVGLYHLVGFSYCAHYLKIKDVPSISHDVTHDNQENSIPPYSLEGHLNDDGREVCEYPADSGNWWWKDQENSTWLEWK